MPRWRKLHVKVTESIDVNDMPDDFTRLIWILLPLALDREGRCQDNASFVKAKIMPLREDVKLAKVQVALDWYEKRNMIECYKVNGRKYFWVPNFSKYQGNTSREADSNYPAPPHNKLRETNSRLTHELVKRKSSTDSDTDSDVETDVDSDSQQHVVVALEEIGIEHERALSIVDNFDSEDILERIRQFEYATREGIASTPGYLIRAITQDWNPPRGYKPDATSERERTKFLEGDL